MLRSGSFPLAAALSIAVGVLPWLGSSLIAQNVPQRLVPVGTASLTGTVKAVDDGRPLPLAVVIVTGQADVSAQFGARAGGPTSPPGPATVFLQRQTLTDANGRFAFSAMPAGRFIVSVSRHRYLPLAYGAARSGRPGRSIPLNDGQQQDVTIALSRGGVISGTVYGQDGEPNVGAQVRAMALNFVGGVRRLGQARFTTTDDRGTYRMFDLPPGEYLVAATPNLPHLGSIEWAAADSTSLETALAARKASRSPASFVLIGTVPSGPPSGFTATYYPSASAPAAATRLRLNTGDERSGIDVQLAYVRAVNVVGTVAGMPGPEVTVMVSLTADDALADPSVMSSQADQNGAFRLFNVAPGRYIVSAQTMAAPRPPGNSMDRIAEIRGMQNLDPSDRLWAMAAITLDGPGTPPVQLVLESGRSISGTVVTETSRPIDLPATTLVLSRAFSGRNLPGAGQLPSAKVGVDGRFTIEGVGPGTYSLRANGPQTKSVVLDGQDLLDFPLDFRGDRDITGVVVTLTDRVAKLSGTLTESSGLSGSGYTVILAAADRRYWTPDSRRVLISNPGVDGRYGFSGLPAGDYLLAAVDDLEPGQQHDPAFLDALARAAIRVTITDGGTRVQDIRVAR